MAYWYTLISFKLSFILKCYYIKTLHLSIFPHQLGISLITFIVTFIKSKSRKYQKKGFRLTSTKMRKFYQVCYQYAHNNNILETIIYNFTWIYLVHSWLNHIQNTMNGFIINKRICRHRSAFSGYHEQIGFWFCWRDKNTHQSLIRFKLFTI